MAGVTILGTIFAVYQTNSSIKNITEHSTVTTDHITVATEHITVTTDHITVATEHITDTQAASTTQLSGSTAEASQSTRVPSVELLWNWCESPISPSLVTLANMSVYQLVYDDRNRSTKLRNSEKYRISVRFL